MRYNPEDALYKEVGVYMKLCYPTAFYRFDFGAGAYLNNNYRLMGLQKAIQMENKKWPDFFLSEPVIMDGIIYHGMYLEMKAKGERIFKKDGSTYVSYHVEQQAACLQELESKGYFAKFAIGIEQVVTFVDSYLSFSQHKKMRNIKF